MLGPVLTPTTRLASAARRRAPIAANLLDDGSFSLIAAPHYTTRSRRGTLIPGPLFGTVPGRLVRNTTNVPVYAYVDVTPYAVLSNLPSDVVRILPWTAW